jgi:hypothetical protein
LGAVCSLASTTQRNNTAGEIELSTIAREPNQFEGVYFIPGRIGEEYAVTVPDGKGKTRTIAWKPSLEYAVAYRSVYLEQRNRELLSAAASTTAATETGDHEQTQP